jgi:hypothetical protein
MNARQIIEAEDPKAFLKKHAPREPMYYRFSFADGAFCFSVMALDEHQAVERAQALLDHIGPSWKLWDSEYIDPTVYAPEEETASPANITIVDTVSDVFNDPEEAVQMWEQEFNALIA